MSPVEHTPSAHPPITIREFEPGDAAAFWTLNVEWIERYFSMEKKDEEVLSNPQYILDRGGRIFFMLAGDERIGCCALLRLSADEFEVGKMAIAPAWQGRGLGRKLLEAVIDAARAAGTRRLYLESNFVLGPAVRLYESMGFQHLPPERVPPSPYSRVNVNMELLLR